MPRRKKSDFEVEEVEQTETPKKAKPKPEPTCETCVAFSPRNTANGVCRMRPPMIGGFPVVPNNQWCMEHKPN